MLNKAKNKMISYFAGKGNYCSYKYFCFRHKLIESDKIFTHLTPQEKRKLFNLACSIELSYAVEIGSFLGASSCFIAGGCNKDSKLICIDTWKNDAMSEGRRDTLKEFRENIKKYNNKIIQIRGCLIFPRKSGHNEELVLA